MRGFGRVLGNGIAAPCRSWSWGCCGEEHDLFHTNVVLLAHRLADGCARASFERFVAARQEARERASADLSHDDDRAACRVVGHKRRGGAALDDFVGFDHRALDVGRDVVSAGDDDQVFDAADDEEVAGVEEAEVARAEPGAVVRALRVIRDRGTEDLAGAALVAPVASRHRLARDPDLTDMGCLTCLACVWIDDADVEAPGVSAPHVRHRARLIRRAGLGDALLHGSASEVHDRRLLLPLDNRDEQRGLREPVAGMEGFAAEAVGGEALRKSVEGGGDHRLGCVERDAPA